MWTLHVTLELIREMECHMYRQHSIGCLSIMANTQSFCAPGSYHCKLGHFPLQCYELNFKISKHIHCVWFLYQTNVFSIPALLGAEHTKAFHEQQATTVFSFRSLEKLLRLYRSVSEVSASASLWREGQRLHLERRSLPPCAAGVCPGQP